MKKSLLALSLLSILAFNSLGAMAAPPPRHHNMHQPQGVHQSYVRYEKNYRPAPPPLPAMDVHYRHDRHSSTGGALAGGLVLGGILGLVLGVNL